MTSHSQVLIPPECGFMIWLQKQYKYWCVSDIENSEKIEKFVNDLFDSKKFDTWRLDRFEVIEVLISMKPASYAELCAVIYAAFARSIRKDFTIWGDKNNYYIDHLNELHDLYEDARFLHIVRDGRDVVCSYREVMAEIIDSPYAPKLETEIHDIALTWSRNLKKIDSLISLLPNEKSMIIKYEDLVTLPKHTISSICEWLDVPFESDMLNFYRYNIKNKLEPELTVEWKKRTLQPISDATVGRHTRMLSDNEKKVFLEYAGDELSRFNYI